MSPALSQPRRLSDLCLALGLVLVAFSYSTFKVQITSESVRSPFLAVYVMAPLVCLGMCLLLAAVLLSCIRLGCIFPRFAYCLFVLLVVWSLICIARSAL